MLRAEATDLIRRGPDERHAAPLDRLRECRVFAQKSVTGMNRFRPGALDGGEDRGHVQVALRGGGRPDADGFVRFEHVARVAIRFGVNGDGSDTEPLQGPLDANRDFPPVRDEDFLEQGFLA